MLDQCMQEPAAQHAVWARRLTLCYEWFAVESGPQMGRSVEKQVRWVWRFVMSPLMFGLVGASVNFKTIDKSIIPKAVAIIVSGQAPVLSTLQMHAVFKSFHSSVGMCMCSDAPTKSFCMCPASF